MIRKALTSVALPALLLLFGTAAPLHAQHDDPNMEWVMDGPLYDRLGGEEMIMGVIDDFVAAAVEEEQLKGHLAEVDQDAWKEALMVQFTFVSGGEIEYEGKSFKESLGEMGITEASMELVAEQLTIALEMNEAWPEDVDELLVALELKEAELTEEEMSEGETAEGEMTEGETAEGSGGEGDAADAGTEASEGDAGDAADGDAADAGTEASGGDADGGADGDAADAGTEASGGDADGGADASGEAGADDAADGGNRE